MNLQALSRRMGMPERQIRYFISEGLLHGAKSTGRNADGFDETHVKKCEEIIKLQNGGKGVREIKKIFEEEKRNIYSDDVIMLSAVNMELLKKMSLLEMDELMRSIRNAIEMKIGENK